MFRTFSIPLTWTELAKRTLRETSADNCLGLAAQLAYYVLLALVPTLVFILALTSFFPAELVQQMTGAIKSFAPGEVSNIIETQMREIAAGNKGGLLTFGILMALWSSSAAMVAITDALNRAYDIEEGRPWWKVRLTAILLTVSLAIFILLAFGLVLAGPAVGNAIAERMGLGSVFEAVWRFVQWPLAFALVALAIGVINYYAPDAEQDWEWVTPGALLATILWLLASLVFRVYVSQFSDYNETYGSLGGIIVLMLWFYISALAVLIGAEMNAEIEHASPHGKEPGEKVPGQKKKLGAAAAREYEARQRGERPQPAPHAPTPAPSPALGWYVPGLVLFLVRRFRGSRHVRG